MREFRSSGSARDGGGNVPIYSASTFRQPGAQYKGVIAKISGGQANCVFSGVPAGNYAVALFHAEQAQRI